MTKNDLDRVFNIIVRLKDRVPSAELHKDRLENIQESINDLGEVEKSLNSLADKLYNKNEWETFKLLSSVDSRISDYDECVEGVRTMTKVLIEQILKNR